MHTNQCGVASSVHKKQKRKLPFEDGVVAGLKDVVEALLSGAREDSLANVINGDLSSPVEIYNPHVYKIHKQHL